MEKRGWIKEVLRKVVEADEIFLMKVGQSDDMGSSIELTDFFDLLDRIRFKHRIVTEEVREVTL